MKVTIKCFICRKDLEMEENYIKFQKSIGNKVAHRACRENERVKIKCWKCGNEIILTHQSDLLYKRLGRKRPLCISCAHLARSKNFEFQEKHAEVDKILKKEYYQKLNRI